jgi:hypothetical protein
MQAVSWRTDGIVANAEGQVAQADLGPPFETRAKAVPAATVPLVTKGKKRTLPAEHHQEIRLALIQLRGLSRPAYQPEASARALASRRN